MLELHQGQRIGQLTLLQEAEERIHRAIAWEVRCSCGRSFLVPAYRFKSSKVIGCVHCAHSIHGHCSDHKATSIYRCWNNMMRRCYDTSCRSYKNYGGRGIRVIQRWHTFSVFLKDLGERPSPLHSLERQNNDQDYKPSNCCWVTEDIQRRNTRRTRLLTYGARTQCLTDWIRELGIATSTMYYHLNRGRSLQFIVERFQKII